jgi:hypothetical protein
LDHSDWRVESADPRGSRRRITKCWPSSKKPAAPCHCQQLSPRPNIPPRMLDTHLPKSRDTPFTTPFNAECPSLVPRRTGALPTKGESPAVRNARGSDEDQGRGWGGMVQSDLPTRRVSDGFVYDGTLRGAHIRASAPSLRRHLNLNHHCRQDRQ